MRASARRSSTYRLRWLGALFAILASLIWVASAPSRSLPALFTGSLFKVQTAWAYGIALLTGAFLTSDCLSEEKRDGTMGLLFLSGLKARDIVFGKFFGAALEAIYVLLALLPVTALGMFLGGVGLAEFWRMALALVNTIFFSLAVGLCVSAFFRNYSNALAGTLGVLLALGVMLPGCSWLSMRSGNASIWSALAWYSPFLPFQCARDFSFNSAEFWFSLVASNAVGWLALALASAALRRSWMDNPAGSKLFKAWLPAPSRFKRRAARKLLIGEKLDPVLLFIGNSAVLQWIAWLLIAACGVVMWTSRAAGADLVLLKACAFFLKILIAFQACRFFVETRRNGALEMLLCTPMKNSDLVAAQWRGLLRVFFWPLLIFLLLCWCAALFSPSLSTPAGEFEFQSESGFSGTILLTISLAGDILAVGWFGMWMGLTLRRPVLAPALTVIAVLILPSLISHFALVVDMFFISWGVTRFQQEFRWVVAGLVRKPEAPA